jgi:MFS family permease
MIMLSVFFASLGVATVYLVPAFAEDLGASYLELGFIGTIRSVPYMFLPVIVGYLGDRFNRRGLYLSSIFIAGAATLLLSAASTIEGIVLVQILLGIGFSLFWPLSEALVSESVPLNNRTGVMGLYAVAWGSGFLIGPLVGGLVADAAGFQMTFLVAGTLVLITAGVSVPTIRGTGKKESRGTNASVKPEWSLVLKLLPMLMIQIPYAIVFAFIASIFPGYATQTGLTSFEVGGLISGFSFTRIVMFSLSGRLGRIGERKSIMFASVGLAAALSLLPLSRGFVQLLGVSCLVGTFIGVIYPQTLGFITKQSPSANLGFAIGLYEAIFGIGFAAGPVIDGFILQATSASTTCLALTIVALSIVPMLSLSKPLEENGLHQL